MEIIQHIKPLINWVHLHPGFAGLITFLISFAESLAIFGLIVPGSVVMSAIGTLVGAGIIPIYGTMAWAALGAVLGDIVSYKVGHHYKDNIKRIWPFKRYPQIIFSAEQFFKRHGGKSVFLGRFVGPMRPIVPLVAGMMRMKKSRFYIFCTIAGILWAPAYMLPGMLIGAASQQLAPETATRFLVTVLIFLTIIWLTGWLFKWIIAKIIRKIDDWMDKFWSFLKTHKHWHWLCRILRDPLHPEGHGQLTMAFTIILLLLLLFLLVVDVKYHGILSALNQPIHQFCRNIHSALMMKFMIFISFIGYKYVLSFMSLVTVIWMCFKRYFRATIHWIFVSVFSIGSVVIFKALYHSPRPEGMMYVAPDANSFPSGHTTFSVAYYGFLAFLIARNFSLPSQRKYIYSFFAILCVLISTSRVYLGVHWLTDVIAGALIGLIIVFIAVISFKRAISPGLKLSGLIPVSILSLLAALPWQITHNYQEMIQIYTPYWPTYSANLNTWWNQINTNSPLYRPNRIGKPVEIMNVQWVSRLEDIRHHLEANGWKVVPKMTLIDLVNRVASNNDEDRLPIIAPLYLGEPPLFTAVNYSSENHVLILYLWASNVEFTDSQLPLWVGTLTYKIPNEHKFWLHKKYLKSFTNLDPPPDELIPFLKGYKYHTFKYDDKAKPPHIPLYEWQGGVIFIMPNDIKVFRDKN